MHDDDGRPFGDFILSVAMARFEALDHLQRRRRRKRSPARALSWLVNALQSLVSR